MINLDFKGTPLFDVEYLGNNIRPPIPSDMQPTELRYRHSPMTLINTKNLREVLLQYSTVVLTVVRVMIAKYRKSGIWGYRSSLTPEPIELKLCMSDYVAHRTQHAPRGN